MWRRRAAQTLAAVHDTGQLVEKNGFSRFAHLRLVWRFLVVWIGACVIVGGLLTSQIVGLRSLYQSLEPVPGGHYTEGVAGTFTTANPLYAVNDVDTSVSRLLFAGLLAYDTHNQLTGDLAESWSADPAGKVYTVRLRPNLTWQDGEPLTADDVVFTYHTIQNPDAQSPLYASWRGVTVQAIDDRIITFTLPNPLSSFPSGLTNGIVPKHLLQHIDPIGLRSATFNTANPVGAGPFRWSSIGISGVADTTEAQIVFAPFDHYWAGAPKLASLSIYAFADTNAMISAYRNQEIASMVGLDHVPAEIARDKQSHFYDLPLTAGVYAFFQTSKAPLNDGNVRQALVAAADREEIIKQLGYQAVPVDEPILKDQFAYDPSLAQATGKAAQAKALLDAAGWHVNARGIREKDGQTLSFMLTASDGYESKRVANVLVSEWRAIGVDATASFQEPADFQSNLAQHQYDAVLDGISIGADPDVYVYWDSSQNDPRSSTQFNFSKYSSGAADVSLEAGRTRLDPLLRKIKYKSFLQAWQQDAPALGLYQPRLVYISHETVYGLDGAPINADADRFRNVQNWMIHTGWVTK